MSKPENIDIRIKLRKVIKDNGYIQARIAKKAGLTEVQLSQILSLTRRLEANELFALCDAIHMTPTELRKYEK